MLELKLECDVTDLDSMRVSYDNEFEHVEFLSQEAYDLKGEQVMYFSLEKVVKLRDFLNKILGQ